MYILTAVGFVFMLLLVAAARGINQNVSTNPPSVIVSTVEADKPN